MTNSNPFLQSQPEGEFKPGIRYGAIIMIGGVIITGINFIMLFTAGYYFPKLLIAGMAMLFLGPVFVVFPGKGMKEKPEMGQIGKQLWLNAPVLHKTAWIVWGIISTGIAFYIMTQLDPEFWR